MSASLLCSLLPILLGAGIHLNDFSAGRGTNGADGGDGGIIEIHVDEENTHLLFSVNWDVSGGLGGAPGHHGNPERGGRGGHGGQGHTW